MPVHATFIGETEMIRTLTFATALALSPLAAIAAPWTLDKAHTVVSFEVEHFGFSTTRGVFREVDAIVDFDPADIAATDVSVTIDAASIDTFWEARDQHLRTSDFLAVEDHPEITFTTTSVAQTGEDTADVTGDLEIRGVTRSVTFAAELRKLGPNPFAPELRVAGFRLTGEIDRSDFGIDYGAPAIGALVPIVIDLELGATADAS
jgi:polyisoprenoid-binding protein YceI